MSLNVQQYSLVEHYSIVCLRALTHMTHARAPRSMDFFEVMHKFLWGWEMSSVISGWPARHGRIYSAACKVGSFLQSDSKKVYFWQPWSELKVLKPITISLHEHLWRTTLCLVSRSTSKKDSIPFWIAFFEYAALKFWSTFASRSLNSITCKLVHDMPMSMPNRKATTDTMSLGQLYQVRVAYG